METILISGGTGMIGQSLTGFLLQKGYRVIVLTRDAFKQRRDTPHLTFSVWDVENNLIDKSAVVAADYIIHLAGAGVAEKRWTAKRKKEIIDSRVKSSALLVKTLSENENRVKAVISISGIGWYGPDPDGVTAHSFCEDNKPFNDFLATTCKDWEESIRPVENQTRRLVIFRTGIVLSNEGGAISEFRKPLRAGIAAILGSGRQQVSWIHVNDLMRMFLFAMINPAVNSIYNAVAPVPVTNKKLVLQLAKASGRYYIPVHIPSIVLKLVLGEMSIEVLKSATVSASKIQKAGFIFNYPSIEEAILQLVPAKNLPG